MQVVGANNVWYQIAWLSQFQSRYESERTVLTCEFRIKTAGACGACGQRVLRWISRGLFDLSTATPPVRWGGPANAIMSLMHKHKINNTVQRDPIGLS